MKNFGIEYPVLLVGIPDELAEKVPQAENLNAFPTTIFVGRDGRIQQHSRGLCQPGDRRYPRQRQGGDHGIVEGLLAEKATRTN